MSFTQTEALVTARRRSADLDRNLVELHVYLVPVEKWQKSRRLANSTVMNESISVGFVRVFPEMSVNNLRREIMVQVGPQFANNDFVFLKNVGRNFTQIKLHQEQQLKAKHFAPPHANDPEIFLINIKREARVETTTSASYVSDDSSTSIKGMQESLDSPLTNRVIEFEQREQQISELSTLIFPNLSLTPQGMLQTMPALEQAVHTEDSGVMSEDEQQENASNSTSPNSQMVQVLNDSFDSIQTEQKDNQDQQRFFGKTAPALVEAIPSLAAHELFQRQEEENKPRAVENTSSLDSLSTEQNNQQQEEKESNTISPPIGQFAPQISQDGDFSVTFVILEEGEGLPVEANAPPPPATTTPAPVAATQPKNFLSRESRVEVEEEDDEEEEEEAEDPQQFKLFRTPSKKIGGKGAAEDGALVKELREVSKLNKEEEARRHLLVGRATDLQNKLRIRKEKKQAALRSQLVVARKTQVPLEHACAQLRLELDAAHQHLLTNMDRDMPFKVKDGPSRKANLKIDACRLQHEIKDLNRTIGSVKLRLESEIKLRTRVEMDIRQCRVDMNEKKAAIHSLRSSRFMPPIQNRGYSTAAISKV